MGGVRDWKKSGTLWLLLSLVIEFQAITVINRLYCRPFFEQNYRRDARFIMLTPVKNINTPGLQTIF